MSDRNHWDNVYSTKSPDGVSWFRPHLDRSLAFLEAAGIGHSAHVIDVGGAHRRSSMTFSIAGTRMLRCWTFLKRRCKRHELAWENVHLAWNGSAPT